MDLAPAQLLARFKERWQVLSQTQKIVASLVTAGVVASLFFIGHLLMRPAYAPLLTGLEPKDAGAIIEELKAQNIPYQVGDQGTTIKVPEAHVYETRIKLASSGALGGGMGFELFDQSKFGQTDFEQQVGYQRALQEELKRTLVQIEGVEQARVHLVIPQKSVFINTEQGTPSASVAIKIKQGARLKPEQIQGICDILVGSLEGLKPENVHIVDTAGNVLSDNLNTSDSRAVMTRAALEQQQARREYERELEKRVQQMLTRILGQDKAVAMVTADLDFNQQQTTSTTSANPDNLKISEHTLTESGTGSEAGGAPGTDSNVTTTPFITGGGSTSYTREENETNYQVNTVQETVVNAPGGVRRLSAAVAVSESDGPVDTQKVREVVAAAIGFDENRGDQINVSGMVFDDTFQKQIEDEMALADTRAKAREQLYSYAMIGGAALFAVLALLALILWRRRAQRVDTPDSLGALEAADTFNQQEPLTALKELEAAQVPLIKDDRQQKIRDLAKDKPEDIAELLKGWIRE